LPDTYDVFLSYHWRDQREVQALAAQLLDEANQLVARLQEGDADDPESLRMKAAALIQRGDLALSYDDLTQARDNYTNALTILERLAQADPSNAGWQKDLLQSYWKWLLVSPKGECTTDKRLAAAEKVLAWFEQTKALDGDAQMPKIRDFFRQYRAERGNGPCREARSR
jgi:tetratricopeptide (TPR) repeat protein